MKAGILYCITNTVNGKQYVGKTVRSIGARWRDHLNCAKRGSPFLLACAIRKYGSENFVVREILSSWNADYLSDLEIAFISDYGSHVSCGGYNMTLGGEGTKRTPEEKAKISAFRKARGLTDEEKAKMKAGRALFHFSEEEHDALVEAARLKNTGRSLSAECRRKISEAGKGRVFDKATKDKIRKAATGRVFSAAARAAISAGLKKSAEKKRNAQLNLAV